MKLLKSLVLASALGMLATLSAHAQSLTYSWTAGEAWQTDHQNFAPTPAPPTPYQGNVYSDQDYSTQSSNAIIHVTNAFGSPYPGGPVTPSGGVYDGFFYTLFSTPTFNLTVNDVLSGVQFIRIEMSFAVSTLGEEGLDFTFGGNVIDSTFNVVNAGRELSDNDVFNYTWDFQVNVTDENAPLSFTWAFNAQHTALDTIRVTQSVEAIPEPSTYALIGAGLAGAAFLRRRRRAA